MRATASTIARICAACGDCIYFAEEGSWVIPGLSRAGINDNNLRSTPDCQTDCLATFHRPPSRDLNKGSRNAVFVNGPVETVSAYPAGNTYVLSWPAGGTPPS
jgi:hypothetical protein